MTAKPMITGFEVIQFDLPPMQDMGTDYNGFNLVYEKGSTMARQASVLRMFTNIGVTGEIAAGPGLLSQASYRNYLLGKNPLERERIYQDLKRALRQQA
ncbi:MAG: mandelate racemase, partial [Anaerolineales bacterium]